ncbi:hypothetical protein ATER59S_02354 [Aquamicrobium terrae]
MTETAADAFARLEGLIAEASEPFEMMHTTARRLVIRATRDAPISAALSLAIDEFHANLEYMTLAIELYGRDQVNLPAHQSNCRAALRVVEVMCHRVN